MKSHSERLKEYEAKREELIEKINNSVEAGEENENNEFDPDMNSRKIQRWTDELMRVQNHIEQERGFLIFKKQDLVNLLVSKIDKNDSEEIKDLKEATIEVIKRAEEKDLAKYLKGYDNSPEKIIGALKAFNGSMEKTNSKKQNSIEDIGYGE